MKQVVAIYVSLAAACVSACSGSVEISDSDAGENALGGSTAVRREAGVPDAGGHSQGGSGGAAIGGWTQVGGASGGTGGTTGGWTQYGGAWSTGGSTEQCFPSEYRICVNGQVQVLSSMCCPWYCQQPPPIAICMDGSCRQDSRECPTTIFDGGPPDVVVDVPMDVNPACEQTADQLRMVMQQQDGKLWGCDSFQGPTGLLELDGYVMDSDASYFAINTCPPNVNCINRTDFKLDAPGLRLNIPRNAFVHVKMEVQRPWGCGQRLLVKNLPDWAGIKNPVALDDRIYFAGSDGFRDFFPGEVLQVKPRALGCLGQKPGRGETPDSFNFEFSDRVGRFGQTVDMGMTAVVHLPYPNNSLLVRNLRSYVSGMCDDDWNWAFWVSYYPMSQDAGVAP